MSVLCTGKVFLFNANQEMDGWGHAEAKVLVLDSKGFKFKTPLAHAFTRLLISL